MDERIWRRLPEDLLDHVFSFLPLKSILNLRSTCKHFNSILFSPCFISKHSFSSSFILLSHPQCLESFALFNTLVYSWCDFSHPFPPSSTLLSSSNGLLCFSIPRSSCFLVCNLLTRSVRHVHFPTCPFNYHLLTLVSKSDGYKLFMLSSMGSSTTNALVYDSKLGSWTHFAGFDPILNENHHQKGVSHNGCLYFTTPEPFHAVRFHLETGQWERSSIGLPDRLTFVRLVSDEDERKLYLIGGVGVSGISRSMKLWELKGGDDGGQWAEIETLPENVCRKFVSVCYHNYEHVYCFWHQGLICVCCFTWPEILYYKVSRRTWHWLPKCPSLPDKWSCGFTWFSFKPHLYATA